MIVKRPKTARYDVYTLIKTGINRRCLLPPLPKLTAQQPELSYPLTSSLYCLRGIVWGCGLKETMTSKYVTESRAGHVTFPRVFPIGLWGVRYSLYII